MDRGYPVDDWLDYDDEFVLDYGELNDNDWDNIINRYEQFGLIDDYMEEE